MEYKTVDTRGIRAKPPCTLVQVVPCTGHLALRLNGAGCVWRKEYPFLIHVKVLFEQARVRGQRSVRQLVVWVTGRRWKKPSHLGFLYPQPPPHPCCQFGCWAAPPCSCCGSPGLGWPSMRAASSCFTAQQARPPSLALSCCLELSPPITSASSVRRTQPRLGELGRGAVPEARRWCTGVTAATSWDRATQWGLGSHLAAVT